MCNMKSLSLSTVFLMVQVAFSYKFPDGFERCHKSDPELDNCLKKAVTNTIKMIGSKGIPSLSLPPIDPMAALELEIGAGTSAVNLVQKYHDVKVLGFFEATTTDVHLDLDAMVLTITMQIPKLEQQAKYEIDGKVLVMPMYGSGDSTQQLFDVKLDHTISFEKESRDGKTYYKIKSYTVRLTPNFASYHFDNLFNGDERLATNILKVLNDNWKDIFDDIKSGAETAYAAMLKGVLTKFFSEVPANELLLD